MNGPDSGTRLRTDSIQDFLVEYASGLSYAALSAEAIHEAKVRVIDTLGALAAGFDGESALVARELALRLSSAHGATLMGTSIKTSLEMAAFANCIAARSAEMMDIYHFPGSFGGHPSDVVMPVLAAAEHAQASGTDLITAIVLAYEIFLRFSDVFHNTGFDDTNFGSVAVAIAACKLWRLTPAQMAHGIAMAVVPNVALKQVRTDELTPWKTIASGHAGRAGIFAALMAQAGIPGPSLPFEGKAGWCDHVARERFSFTAMGGGSVPFKILDTRIKHRPAAGETISSIIAAEKIAPMLANVGSIREVTVEIYRRAMERAGNGAHHWNPRSRDAAGNSIPYVVSAALIDGTVRLQSFDDARFDNPELRALMKKVKLVENDEFTTAYQRTPVEHRTRITVVTADGKHLVAESGGDDDDLSAVKSDAQIEAKFRGLSEPVLGAQRASAILDRLWNLEHLADCSVLAPAFVLQKQPGE